MTAMVLAGCTDDAAEPADFVAAERATIAVPLLRELTQPLAANLIYEANNALVRGAADDGRLTNGAAVAGRWQRLAERTAGLFVLRDSLWSQQDHPTRQQPHHLMLPPSWILIAASQAQATPVTSFPLDDDAAWESVANPRALFGAYPSSEVLYRLATSSRARADGWDRERILYARESLRQLSHMTMRLRGAAADGWRAVVVAGAELIAQGDRDYFGAQVRRARIIPIFVENPSPREVDEGKGYVVPGLEAGEEIERFLVNEICRARLRDGDIALERYDLSNPADVSRALNVLEHVIPQGDTSGSGKVWLWVNGRLTPGTIPSGEGALAYVGSFNEAVARRPIDATRLRMLNKPMASVDGQFGQQLSAFRDAGLYMSVAATPEDLQSLATASQAPP